VAFMTRYAPTAATWYIVADKEAKVDAKSVPTWRTTHKLFFEEDARQLPGLESCGKRSRKGKKKEELENFLLTVNDYMAARAGVATPPEGYKSGEVASRLACGATAGRPYGKTCRRLGAGRPAVATVVHYMRLTSTQRMPARRAASRPKSVSS